MFLHAEPDLVSMLCNAGADVNAKNMLGGKKKQRRRRKK